MHVVDLGPPCSAAVRPAQPPRALAPPQHLAALKQIRAGLKSLTDNDLASDFAEARRTIAGLLGPGSPITREELDHELKAMLTVAVQRGQGWLARAYARAVLTVPDEWVDPQRRLALLMAPLPVK